MMLGMEEVSSECSSGCQSGWTMYFDQSSYSNKCKKSNRTMEQEEEEEDLSMVSDASSGPSPFLHEEEYYEQQMTMHGNVNYGKKEMKNKKRNKRVGTEKYEKKLSSSSYLDDTASSPLFDYTQSYNGATNPAMETVMDFSCAFSTNHFNEKPVYQNHFSYFQSPSLIEPLPQRPKCKESGKKNMW
ncbi:hypothetical protein LUZ60_005938 [Juncus effusus]|nr:hypothetical protein LUZ60_005938 [Juncus effusus]